VDLTEKMNGNLYRHPWEKARVKSIISLIPRSKSEQQFADVGAGDMFFTGKLTDLVHKKIYAVDVNYKKSQNDNNLVVANSISEIPDNSIDVLFLLDVLEHIEDENNFLQKLQKKIKKDGSMIITVPAFNFLFSPHDVFLKHYRRYNLKQLITLLKDNDFTINYGFYFFTNLFFFRSIQVILHKMSLHQIEPNNVGNWSFSADKLITKLITWLLIRDFKMNFILQKFKIKLLGLSICIKCQKKLV
jgi:hypothetical protein